MNLITAPNNKQVFKLTIGSIVLINIGYVLGRGLKTVQTNSCRLPYLIEILRVDA